MISPPSWKGLFLVGYSFEGPPINGTWLLGLAEWNRNRKLRQMTPIERRTSISFPFIKIFIILFVRRGLRVSDKKAPVFYKGVISSRQSVSNRFRFASGSSSFVEHFRQTTCQTAELEKNLEVALGVEPRHKGFAIHRLNHLAMLPVYRVGEARTHGLGVPNTARYQLCHDP